MRVNFRIWPALGSASGPAGRSLFVTGGQVLGAFGVYASGALPRMSVNPAIEWANLTRLTALIVQNIRLGSGA